MISRRRRHQALEPGPPLVVISPHLDDAVLSCAEVLRRHPGSTVITAFAGRPSDGRWSNWDRTCFRAGQDPIPVRREEDRRALAMLGASPIHLPFLDVEYEEPCTVEEVAGALERQLADLDPPHVLVPLGIKHHDHEMTHRAASLLFDERRRWTIYAELPYRVEYGDLVARRRRELEEASVELTPEHVPRDDNRLAKLAAIQEYRSQVRALGEQRIRRSLRRERYWRVTGLPGGTAVRG